MHVALVFKPRRDPDDARVRDDIAAEIRARGHVACVYVTEGAGDAERHARGAVTAGCELVLARGGDGTIHEVANGLLRGGAGRVRLAIIAGGTANDFVRGQGLPESLPEALRVAFEGEVRALDAGVVNGRSFVNVSTGGFGAQATRAAATPLKRRLGPLAYLAAGARRLREFRPYRARFVADGEEVFDAPFAFYAVGNSWRTGGGTRVTPRAAVSDGRLDVAIVGVSSRFDLLTLLPDLRRGSHIASPDVRYLRASRLQVEPAAALPVNADGEPVEGRSFSYEVRTEALRLMVPSA